ncbi:MAG TPA: amidase [Gammaproteobacteria bacterium]|nr:amidase [Gammaproteobacteria bacterium]
MTNEVMGRRDLLALAGVGLAAGVMAGCGQRAEPGAGSAASASPTAGGAPRAGADSAPGGVGVASAASAAAAKPSGDLFFMTATQLAGLLRSRAVSAREVMAAHLERIAHVNPKLNAIVAKLDDERCLALADEADKRAASGAPLPPLHGLPTAFKDLQSAVGFPYTRGSLIYKDAMPTEDSAFVERMRAAGVIAIGKTNVPEFGLGSHTFNKVYGTTVNPYDTTKSAGGSSGGAAASLASGMLPIADGSDNGGSLRNPGNFNNVVGFRPTFGLVPSAPNALPFLGVSVSGPLARAVDDVALLMSVMAGPDPRDPSCYPSDPTVFRGSLERDFRGVRVAWCPDLGGLPLDPRVRDVLAAQRATFDSLGCVVEDVAPDLKDAEYAFITIRSFRSAATYGPLLDQHRDLLKQDAIEEIEAGRAVTNAELARAMLMHAQLMERMRKFQETYAFTLCAVNQLPPFDAKIDWPHEIAGVPMEHYIAWQKTCYWISATQRPAISVPAGFTPEGLPVGIQIVGRHREDRSVLELGRAFEQATKFGERRPSI